MSTAPLFFVDEIPAGDEIVLTGDEGRHAARVKRLDAGEAISIGDGKGLVVHGIVSAVRPDGLSVTARERVVSALPVPRIVVVQALPKGDRAELAVEVLTELGADEIVPWSAARSIAQWHGERGERAREKWQRTAREAAKQSRRPWVPTVAPLATTSDLVARIAGSAALVLHESAVAPLASAALPSERDLLVVVGPEGGITDDELGALDAAGAQAVRLGTPVLRTSTAGAAALAALSVRLDRWA